MAKFCEQNKIIEDLQFGSRKGRSAPQALITFRTIIDDACKHDKDLFVMYLDFAKAYDSVEHIMLERAMTYYNIPQDIIDKIMNIYEDNEATLFSPHGRTKKKIPIQNGVKQGDSLSPLLFILFINPMLTKLRESGCGYRFHNDKEIHIPNITYSDDNTLLASTQEDMQKLADIVMAFCEYTGVELNPSKYIYTYKTKEAVKPITINNCKIRAVQWNEAQRLLGLKSEISQNYETQMKDCVSSLQLDINYITNKNLYLKQRIQIINSLLIPKILYKMNVLNFDDSHIKKMNNIVVGEARKAIRCPRNYSDQRFWKETKDGGMGLLNLKVVNEKTIINTFMNQAINHASTFPKKCIIHQLKEQGLTVATMSRMNNLKTKDKSYLLDVARALKEMPFKIIEKQTRQLSDITLNLNEGNHYTLYDKISHKTVTAVFTDGSYSQKTGQAGAACAYGPNNVRYWPAKYKTTSYGTELEGLEVAIATAKADIIFCDCLGAMNAVGDWKDKTPKDKNKDKNRGILRNLESLIQQRKLAQLEPLEIIWVPSHTEGENKIITNKMKTQIKLLQTRFSMKAIRKYNSIVDKAAKEGANNDVGVRTLPQMCDDYVVLQEEEIKENSTNK
jgi:ribonuclease HI